MGMAPTEMMNDGHVKLVDATRIRRQIAHAPSVAQAAQVSCNVSYLRPLFASTRECTECSCIISAVRAVNFLQKQHSFASTSVQTLLTSGMWC